MLWTNAFEIRKIYPDCSGSAIRLLQVGRIANIYTMYKTDIGPKCYSTKTDHSSWCQKSGSLNPTKQNPRMSIDRKTIMLKFVTELEFAWQDRPISFKAKKRPVLISSTSNCLGQVIGSASEEKYNTVNNTTSGGSNLSKISEFGDYLLVQLKIVANHWHSPLEPTRAYT